MPLPVFTFCPEFGAREVRAPRTSPFKFGNGRERRYRFGLVTDLRTWELSFDYNTDVRREEILAFLEERGAWRMFEWTDPKGYFARWRCKTWQTSWNGPRQSLVTCTFIEADERVGVIVPPEPVVVPDMWLSRMTTEVGGNTRQYQNSMTIRADGGSYHIFATDATGSPDAFKIYIVRRNVNGGIIWQKTIPGFLTAPVGNIQNLRHIATLGPQNELYLMIHEDRIIVGSVGAIGSDFPVGPSVFAFSEDGEILWQKSYRLASFQNFQSVSAGLNQRSTNGWLIKVSPVENSIYLVMARNSPARPGVIIARLSRGDGAIQSSVAFDFAVQDSDIRALHSKLFVLSGRIVLICGITSVVLSVVAELSLDLGTVFSLYRYDSVFWSRATVNPSDNSIIAYGTSSTTFGGDAKSSPYFLTSAFSVAKRQYRPGALEWLPAETPIAVNAAPDLGYIVGTPVVDGSNTVIPCAQYQGASTALPWVANFTPQNRQRLIFSFDHNDTKSASWATAVSAYDAGSLSFAPSVHGVCVSGESQSYNAPLGFGVGCHADPRFAPPSMYVAAYGYKAKRGDEGERWLDCGLSVSSRLFMTMRSQLNPAYITAEDETSSFLLPPRSDQLSNWTPRSHSLTATDWEFATADSSEIAWQLYVYNDPAFTTPAAEGDAGVAFYAGNNAVQEVNVGRAFTPSLVFHASRNNAGPLANPGIKHLFSGQAGWDRFCGTDSTSTHGTTPDGVLEAGTGYFKISGRKLNTTRNWNELSVEYAVLALGLLVGGHTAVTYTGNGASSQSVAHGLGVAPELVFLFPHLTSAALPVGGSLLAAGQSLLLDSTAAAATNSNRIQSIDSSAVTVGGTGSGLPNTSGVTWTMHSFASSAAWDIGTFTGAGTGTHAQSLGYQPKALILKNIIGGTGNWWLLFREDDTPGVARAIPLNTTAAEAASADVSLTADGFTVLNGGTGNTGTVTALYFAIR